MTLHSLAAALKTAHPATQIHPSVVTARDAYGGTGLFLSAFSAPVEAGELLVAIPRTAMVEGRLPGLHERELGDSGDDRSMDSGASEEPGIDKPTGNAELAMAILLALDSGRKELEYLPTLTELEFHPMTWDPNAGDTLNKLERTVALLSCIPESERALFASELLNRIKEQQDNWITSYSSEFDARWSSVSHSPVPLFERYLWARILAASRAMHLWSGATLVPFADLMNYNKVASVLVGTEVIAAGGRNDGTRDGSETVEGDPDAEAVSDDDSESDFSSDESYFAYLDALASRKADASRNSVKSSNPPPSMVPRDAQFLTIRAARDLKAGEELVFNYFSYPLDHSAPWDQQKEGITKWLLSYGFVP